MCPPADPERAPPVEGETKVMVMIGIDAHKRSYTVVVVDERGAVTSRWRML
jgi:hypothetical protein